MTTTKEVEDESRAIIEECSRVVTSFGISTVEKEDKGFVVFLTSHETDVDYVISIESL